MKTFQTLILLLLAQFTFVSSSSAGDFDWMRNLDVLAEADASGFHLRLSTRFHLGDTQINAVISNVGSSSEAYMVFRLGELSHRPINEVMDVYHAHRKKGWGAIAKHLGIKPGSREFHALKRGHDMEAGHSRNSRKSSGKHHGMGNGMGKNRH